MTVFGKGRYGYIFFVLLLLTLILDCTHPVQQTKQKQPQLDPNLVTIDGLVPKLEPGSSQADVMITSNDARYHVMHASARPGLCFSTLPETGFCDQNLDGIVDYWEDPQGRGQDFWQKQQDEAVVVILKHYGKPVVRVDRDF